MSLQVAPKSLFVVMLCGLRSFHLVSNSYLPRRLSVTSDYLGGQTFSVEGASAAEKICSKDEGQENAVGGPHDNNHTLPSQKSISRLKSRSQMGDFFGRKWRLVTVLVVVRNATDFATSSTIGAHDDPDGQ